MGMVGGNPATLPLPASGISGIFSVMLHLAIWLTGVYVTIWSVVLGWIAGARVGDERGVLAYSLGAVAAAATVVYGLSA